MAAINRIAATTGTLSVCASSGLPSQIRIATFRVLLPQLGPPQRIHLFRDNELLAVGRRNVQRSRGGALGLALSYSVEMMGSVASL